MTCVNTDGTLTESEKSLLRALQKPLTAEEISTQTTQPLFEIRNGLYKMVDSGLAASYREQYVLTDKGRAIIAEPELN